MDSGSLAKHKVSITKNSLNDLKTMSRDVSDKLYTNFIQPIENGFIPPADLQGKYKPSSEMKFITSPMAKAFVDESKKHNLHHYHFGYKFYRDGHDDNYDGYVSDGIIHTKVICGSEVVSHNILEVCLEHPSPFKVPYLKVDDDLVSM